jgi:uncharacterized protein (DUF58 family)
MHPQVRLRLNFRLLPVLVLILLVVRILDPYAGWTILLVGLGSAWLVSYLWARSLMHNLKLTREVRFGWAQVGDRLEERFTLANRGFFPALWVEVIDHTDMPGYSGSAATGVGGYGENRWHAAGVCSQRGLFTHGPTTLRSGDPFGIYTVEIQDPKAVSLLVAPPVLPLPDIQVVVGGWSEEGDPRGRSVEKTFDASSARPYLPGDQPRWIHWRTTARRSELYVRIFDGAPAGDWWLILDLDQSTQAGEGSDTNLEHAVILAASLANYGLRDGRHVGLSINAHEPVWLPPHSGDGQRWEILRMLALASPADRHLGEFSASLPINTNRRASYILITANTDISWLAKLVSASPGNATPMVLLLDPLAYESGGSSIPEDASQTYPAELARQQLLQLGISVQVIPKEIFDRPEKRPGKRGTRQWRVTPSGRAVQLGPSSDQEWVELGFQSEQEFASPGSRRALG